MPQQTDFSRLRAMAGARSQGATSRGALYSQHERQLHGLAREYFLRPPAATDDTTTTSKTATTAAGNSSSIYGGGGGVDATYAPAGAPPPYISTPEYLLWPLKHFDDGEEHDADDLDQEAEFLYDAPFDKDEALAELVDRHDGDFEAIEADLMNLHEETTRVLQDNVHHCSSDFRQIFAEMWAAQATLRELRTAVVQEKEVIAQLSRVSASAEIARGTFMPSVVKGGSSLTAGRGGDSLGSNMTTSRRNKPRASLLTTSSVYSSSHQPPTAGNASGGVGTTSRLKVGEVSGTLPTQGLATPTGEISSLSAHYTSLRTWLETLETESSDRSELLMWCSVLEDEIQQLLSTRSIEEATQVLRTVQDIGARGMMTSAATTSNDTTSKSGGPTSNPDELSLSALILLDGQGSNVDVATTPTTTTTDTTLVSKTLRGITGSHSGTLPAMQACIEPFLLRLQSIVASAAVEQLTTWPLSSIMGQQTTTSNNNGTGGRGYSQSPQLPRLHALLLRSLLVSLGSAPAAVEMYFRLQHTWLDDEMKARFTSLGSGASSAAEGNASASKNDLIPYRQLCYTSTDFLTYCIQGVVAGFGGLGDNNKSGNDSDGGASQQQQRGSSNNKGGRGSIGGGASSTSLPPSPHAMAWVRDQIASFVNSVLVPHLWAMSTMPRVTSEMQSVGGGGGSGDLYASPPYVALSTAVRCIDQVRALQSNPGIGHCEHHMLRLLIDGGSGRAVGFGALPTSGLEGGKGDVVQPSGLIPSICERQLYNLIEALTTLTNASAMGVIAAVLEAAKSAAPSNANNKINCSLSPSVMAAYLSLDGDLFSHGDDKPNQPPSVPASSPWGRAVRVLHNDLSDDVQVAVRATCAFIVTDISRQNLAACRQLYSTLVSSSSSTASPSESSKTSLSKISRFGAVELGLVRSSHHASDHTFAPHTIASLVSLLLVPHTAYTRPQQQQPGTTNNNNKATMPPPVIPATSTTSYSRGGKSSSAAPTTQTTTNTTTSSVLLSPHQLSPSHTLFLRSACGIGPTARGFVRSVNELCSMLSVHPSGALPSSSTTSTLSPMSSNTTTSTSTPTLLLCREYVSLCDNNLSRLFEGFLVGYTSNVSSTLHHTLDKAVVSIRGTTSVATQQPSIVVAAGIVSSTAAMAGAAQLALFSDALCGVMMGALALGHVDQTVGRVPHFTNKPVMCTPQCPATRRLGFAGRGTKAPFACEALRCHATASLSRTIIAALASLGLAHAAPGIYSPSTASTNGTPTVAELTASSPLPFLHGDLRRWKAATVLQEASNISSNGNGNSVSMMSTSAIDAKTSMDTGLLIRALLDAFVYSPYRPSDSTPTTKPTTTTAPSNNTTPGGSDAVVVTVRWLYWRAVGSPDSARECSVRHLVPRYPTFPLRIPTITPERSEHEAAMDCTLIELLRDENNLLKGTIPPSLSSASALQKGVSASTSSPNLAMAHYAIQLSLKLLSAAQTILVGPLAGGGGNDPSEGTQLSGMWAFLRDVCMSPLVFTTNPDPAHWRNVIGGMLQPYISSSWEKDMRSSWLQSRGCLSNDSPTGAATFPSVVVLLQVLVSLLMKNVFSQGTLWDRLLLGPETATGGSGGGRAWHYRTGRARDDAVSHILVFFGVMRYIWQPLLSGSSELSDPQRPSGSSLIALVTSITSEVIVDVEAAVIKKPTSSGKDDDEVDDKSSQWGPLEEVINRAPEILLRTHNIPLGASIRGGAMLDSRPEVQAAVDAAKASINIRYHCATGDVALEEHQKSRARREREREEAEARADPMPEPPKMAELNTDDLESTKAELDLTSALAQLQAEGDEDPSQAEERDLKLLALSRELAQFEREKIQRRKKREASMKQLQGEHAAQLEGYQRELEAYKYRRAEAARQRALADETANKVSDFLGIEQLRALVCELVAPLSGTV